MLEGRIEDLESFVQNSGEFDGKGNLTDKLTRYIDDLANIVDEAAMSAEIRRYLSFFAKFKGHSWNNTILIYIQRPDATQVAGFRDWEKKYFRKVKQGAKGIMIFAPVFTKGEAPANDADLDKEIAGFDVQIERLKALKKQADTNRENLVEYVKNGMLTIGKDKIDLGLFKLSIRAATKQLPEIIDESILSDEFFVVVPE